MGGAWRSCFSAVWAQAEPPSFLERAWVIAARWISFYTFFFKLRPYPVVHAGAIGANHYRQLPRCLHTFSSVGDLPFLHLVSWNSACVLKLELSWLTGSYYIAQAGIELAACQGWFWTSDLSAFTSQVLLFQISTTMPDLCSTHWGWNLGHHACQDLWSAELTGMCHTWLSEGESWRLCQNRRDGCPGGMTDCQLYVQMWMQGAELYVPRVQSEGWDQVWCFYPA